MNLSDSPGRPACPSRASGWPSLTTPWGLPCCVRFPCVHAVATTPAQRLGVLLRSFTQPYQPSPKGSSGRPAHRPFRGLLGVHSRYGLHTRAVTVDRDTLSEGFSHSSIAAPVASGWSGCRVGLAPTGKRRLSTAHTLSRLRPRRRISRMARKGLTATRWGAHTRKNGLLATVTRTRPFSWPAEDVPDFGGLTRTGWPLECLLSPRAHCGCADGDGPGRSVAGVGNKTHAKHRS